MDNYVELKFLDIISTKHFKKFIFYMFLPKLF